MRILVLYFLFVVIFSVNSFALDSSEKNLEYQLNDNEWVSSVSSNATSMTLELRMINEETSKEEVEEVLKKVLTKVQDIRKNAEKYGIKVEGFSLDLNWIPSITINFTFID